MPRRVLIVGGVAGGASAAARLRRLDEEAEIVLFDRGPHVSFANCGLPYFVGNVIADERRLLVASRELFRDRFNIDVRTEHEVTAIDRDAQTIRVRELRRRHASATSATTLLVLAPGAAPIRPPRPASISPASSWCGPSPTRAASARGSRSRRAARPSWSAAASSGSRWPRTSRAGGSRSRCSRSCRRSCRRSTPRWRPRSPGISARRASGSGSARASTGSRPTASAWRCTRTGTRTIGTDLVILAIGVRPEADARAGRGPRHRRPRRHRRRRRGCAPPIRAIWAVGDAIEVRDVVIGQEIILPLAGPANRQGRVAAEAIAGRATRFRGVQATAVVGVFGLTVATTGASEKGLRRAGRHRTIGVVYLHPGHHAGYYPGATPIHLKLLYSREDGRILGAQAVGQEGVDKRIDVIASDDPDARHACTISPRPSSATRRSSARPRTPSTSPA